LAELFSQQSIVLGLDTPQTLKIVDTVLKDNLKLHKRLFTVLDEADLVTFDLDSNRTKTEEALLSVFPMLHSLLSVTGTPASILLCDKINTAYILERPNDYYGIERIEHIELTPERPKRQTVRK